MAKRKFNIDAILQAGEGAHLVDKEIPDRKTGGDIDGEQFVLLNVNEIEDNPLQPRRNINEKEIEELAANIDLHGLIQPITVIKVSDQKLILLAGQRRLLAHKILKKEKIKAIVREDERFSSLDKLGGLDEANLTKALFEISVSENELREPLSPLELALSIDEVLKKGAYRNINDIASVLGKSKSYVTKIYSTLKLSPVILDDLRESRGVGHIEALYELQKVSDKKLQEKLYFQLKNGEINIDDIRRYSVSKTTQKSEPFKLKLSRTEATLKINTRRLSKELRDDLQKELEEIAKRYSRLAGAGQ